MTETQRLTDSLYVHTYTNKQNGGSVVGAKEEGGGNKQKH